MSKILDYTDTINMLIEKIKMVCNNLSDQELINMVSEIIGILKKYHR